MSYPVCAAKLQSRSSVSHLPRDVSSQTPLGDRLFLQRGNTRSKRQHLNRADFLRPRQVSVPFPSNTSTPFQSRVNETNPLNPFSTPSVSTGLAEGLPSISIYLSMPTKSSLQVHSETSSQGKCLFNSIGDAGLFGSSEARISDFTLTKSHIVSSMSNWASPITTSVSKKSSLDASTISIPNTSTAFNSSMTSPHTFTTMTTKLEDTTTGMATSFSLPPKSSTTSNIVSTSPLINSTSISSVSPSSSPISFTSSFASTDMMTSLNTSFGVFPTTTRELNSTVPFSFTSRFPAYTSDTGATTFISTFIPPEPSSLHSTIYGTRTSIGLSITHSSIVQTGILSSDNPSPNQNAFAHHTGAIIGVALAGTLAVIISMIIVFLMCKRHHYHRNGRRGIESDVNSVGIGGSRENFLRREVDAMTCGDEGPPSSQTHGIGTTGYLDAVMLENRGSVPASFPSFPCFDGNGIDGSIGAMSGGFGSGASDESAGMYPPQSHALATSYSGVEYTLSTNVGQTVPMSRLTGDIPPLDETTRPLPSPSSPLHLRDSTFWSSSSADHMSSPTQPLASDPYPQQPRDHSHSYRSRAATAGHIGSAGTGYSDPFGDTNSTKFISTLSVHGHPDTSSEAVASLGDSSTQGHLIPSVGHGIGTGNTGRGEGGGRVMASSLEHDMRMIVSKLRTPSPNHGHGEIGPVEPWSISNSPTTELKGLHSSTYVPFPSTIPESNVSSGSGGSKSSGRGLLGKLKVMSKNVKSNERVRESDEMKWSPHAHSSCQSGWMNSSDDSAMLKRSTAASTSMPMGGLPTQSNYPRLPSSLLNPPNAIPIPPLRSPISTQRDGNVSPVPSIQGPQTSMDITGEYHLFTEHPEYGLHNEYEAEDIWTSPTIGGHLLRPPSPVSTETSSCIEGLLNPRMLPGGGGDGGISGGSGVSKAAKRQAPRGTHSAMGSTDSGAASSLRSLGFAPGHGQYHGGLGMYDEGERGSVMSLRDNVDYSRPISGNVVVDRMKSTTTFESDFGGDWGTVATDPSPVPMSGEVLGDVNMSVRGEEGLLGPKNGEAE